jgi:catechol 2,3-dioxygenase-like lactoylglutathione lyase family enzyme
MRLNHLDLPVPDVARTRDFFVDHLGFRHRETKGDDALAILEGDHGFILVISRLRAHGAQGFPADFHVGFHLESREAVEALHDRLAGAGVEIMMPPRAMRGGWGLYFRGPNGLLVEASWMPSLREAAG